MRSPTSEIAVYDSLFTSVECEEIYTELLETIEKGREQMNSYGKHGETTPAHKIGISSTMALPWTDMLLDIKQFVEDGLNLEFNTAILTKRKDFPKEMITTSRQNGSLLFVQGEKLVAYFYLHSVSLEHPPIINIVFSKI